jgi:internalin A
MPPDKRPSARALAEATRRITECRNRHTLSLDLSGLNLTQLPEELRDLLWLKELNLQNNHLTQIPDWVGNLTSLNILNAYKNPLETILTDFTRLVDLKTLRIGGGKSSAVTKSLGSLQQLETLALSHQCLAEIPTWVRRLKNLTTLSVSGNYLTKLPTWLENLEKLERLDVSDNYIRALPKSILELKSLKTLHLDENPKLSLPNGILKSEDARQILDYYFLAAGPEASKRLNEFKLVLVGRGGVGKTTLVNRLVEDKYKEFQRTPGIEITRWLLPVDGTVVRAHVWDFGGQEILHGTHRFFMTDRALYLVLISGREGTEDHDAEYWLSMVRSFAGDAPVIVLLHKWSDYRFELNHKLLREKYGRDLIFIATDSLTGHGIGELREQIRKLATTLPGLHAAWPSAWWRVKDDLPLQRKSWMSFDYFRSFCNDRGIADRKAQERLAESLHDLGLMLSYRKDEALRDFGVLKPQWVTEGIYKMLNAAVLQDAGGKFTLETFGQVLPKRTYPKALHPYLLALMRKFQLCHPLDEKGEKYLIPELLTKEEPSLDTEFPPDKCLGFIYRYDSVLPEGLLPRFIVETYVHREPKHAWRTGVVLERANCRALVRGDVQGRTITIRVGGVSKGRRELLGIIREHFERIHKSYEKLPVTELVPIPGHPEAQVKHDLLLKHERAGRQMIAVDIGDDLQDFPVTELLDGVDLPGAPRSRAADSKGIADRELFEHRDAIPVFISYARKDETFRDQLRAALVPYERKSELAVWDEELIVPGQVRETEMHTHLERAQIIILLLSSDFLSSSDSMDKELPLAMERRAKGECEIVPITVRTCRYDKLELGAIKAIEPNAKPINKHRDRDSAWLEVTKELDRVIEKLKNR